jgi:hypothetical protein
MARGVAFDRSTMVAPGSAFKVTVLVARGISSMSCDRRKFRLEQRHSDLSAAQPDLAPSGNDGFRPYHLQSRGTSALSAPTSVKASTRGAGMFLTASVGTTVSPA